MITINHTRLRMSGALNIEHLTALKLHIGVNTHGWAVVEGEAGETALEQLSGALAGREQHILTLDESGAEKCLFAGVIREAELVRVGGYNRFHVALLSGTCLMDREVRSRSFQDVGRTYSQVAQQVCSEYSGGAAICTVGEDKTLGQPVIQYRETDWEFLMRMASHCGGVLVPETHRGLPRLWFGFPDRSFTCEFPEDAYTSGISQRYYELGGSEAGYSKADFFYYDVESPQLCDLGWYTVFKGQPFIISEKYAILERGELIFTYRLGRPGLGWGKMLYNEKISGMTLLGEVLETSRETLKLKLDIDAGWNPGGPYPYTWRPETGNFMYCMPQVGTRVSLYCPNYDEKAAIAVNCVRTNGSDCDRMSDPAKRSFVTEHGKEMNLYPEEMSLIGGSNGLCDLSDEDGITIGSEKPVVIIASEEVKFEAAQVVTQALVGEIVAAKGDPVTGDVDSSLVVCNNYDAVVQNITGAEGWNHIAYGSYDDAPTESTFNVWDLVGNVLAGIVTAVAVGVIIGVTVVAIPAAIGAIAAASSVSVAVGAAVITAVKSTFVAACIIGGISAAAGSISSVKTMVSDIQNQHVSDRRIYEMNAQYTARDVGSKLQTVYGIYNLVKLAPQLPNILRNLGNVLSALGNNMGGGSSPALVLVGADGGNYIYEGAKEFGAILTGEQLLGLVEGLGHIGTGSIMYAKNARSGGVQYGSGGRRGVPVPSRTTASNGLNYQSNPKHTPGQPGNHPKAGVEPENSLELFENSIESKQKPGVRFALDEVTGYVHRFFSDAEGTLWHWSGSMGQGANSLTGAQIPNDIKRYFNLPMKRW